MIVLGTRIFGNITDKNFPSHSGKIRLISGLKSIVLSC